MSIAEAPTALEIGADDCRRYREDGCFLLDRAVGGADLAMLRDECDHAIAFLEGEMDARGSDHVGLNHRGQRYILPLQYKMRARLQPFLFGEAMAEICRATLGGEAYLFLEQFVVKGPHVGLELGWHQDSGYIPYDVGPYVTAWIALDDVDAANGTIYVLPYDRAGSRETVPHDLQSGTNDKVGYFGDDPGEPVVAPAGSVAVFSSTTFHRSGGNSTPALRRAYIVQYSARPILTPDGAAPRHFADPFLKDGRIVPQPSLAELNAAPAEPWTWSD